MSEDTKKETLKKEKTDADCVKPNNPEAQRFEDEDDACHEATDGK